MKQEINWMGLWILINVSMAILSLTYFYLNKELSLYGDLTMSVFLLLIVLPYSIWKYKRIRFVEKRSIVIQILND